MRILVTGGAGFLGSHLCDALLAEGHTVVAVDNLLTGRMRNLEHLIHEPRFDFKLHDICDPFDFGKVDYIFNFASPASPVDYMTHAVETLKVGSLGVFNALEQARKYNAKFLTSSTSECYGDPLEHPQSESYWGHVNPIGPRSVYDEAKRFAEAATMAFSRYHQVDTRIVRIFNTYGPRLQLNDGRVISNFMRQALRGDDLTVYGNGLQTRSFCYVSDEIDGILRLAHSDEHLPTNVGNPQEFTILECAELVLKVTGSNSSIIFEPLPVDDPKQRCPDITKARQKLLWEPKIDLEAGLKLSMNYFRECLAAEQAQQTLHAEHSTHPAVIQRTVAQSAPKVSLQFPSHTPPAKLSPLDSEGSGIHIAVIGSGYVGLVAGACFAEIGHNVVLVDNDPRKCSALVAGDCPIHEEYLPELLARNRGRRLTFSNNLEEAVRSSQAVFIAVGTPPTMEGEADLSYVEAVAREIAGCVDDYKVIVGKSTVPVYTSEWVRKVMQLNGAPSGLFEVASNPEFLREGTAVTDFLYPDRIVVGVDSPKASGIMREIYKPLLDGSYYRRADAISGLPGTTVPPPILITSAKSAELIKYASNAFLAMKISFINAVATICDSVGADVDQVRQGIGSDARIGPRFLCPGIGYGGSCFPKDLSAYRAVARECGYDFRLLEEVVRINDEQQDRFIRKVRRVLWTIKGKRIGVLGLAFKGGTDDIRESPAISIVEWLLAEGAQVQAYDPAAMERAKEVLPLPGMLFVDSAYDAAEGADALLVLTEWDEFKHLDYARIRGLLRFPIVVDGRNLLNPDEMTKLDFEYVSMGRPDVSINWMSRQAKVEEVA